MRIFVLSIMLLLIFLVVNTNSADDIKAIESEFNNKDWGVRYSVLDKIKDISKKDSITFLIKVVSNRAEYWPIKIKAIQLLGKSHDPEALNTLLTIFNDPFLNWECPSIKSYTAYALGNFKNNHKVFNSLINAVDDKEVLTREAVITSLGKIANPEAIPYLLNALNDKSIAVRLSALKSLEEIGDINTIPYIQNFINREIDSTIKEMASIILNNISTNHK